MGETFAKNSSMKRGEGGEDWNVGGEGGGREKGIKCPHMCDGG